MSITLMTRHAWSPRTPVPAASVLLVVAVAGLGFTVAALLRINESRTVFSADGPVAGKVRIHAISHVTYQDLNGDGNSDPGRSGQT